MNEEDEVPCIRSSTPTSMIFEKSLNKVWLKMAKLLIGLFPSNPGLHSRATHLELKLDTPISIGGSGRSKRTILEVKN